MMLENFAAELAIIATVMGTIMSMAYFPQIHKIWKRKSVDDISLAMFAIFFPGIIVWLLYGISINNFPLIIANAVGAVGAGTVIALYFRYKKR